MTVWYNQLAPRKSTIYKFHVFSTNSSCYDEKGPALKKMKNNLLFFFSFSRLIKKDTFTPRDIGLAKKRSPSDRPIYSVDR